MDFDSIIHAIWNQFVTVWHAPVPFFAAVVVVGYVVWKIIQWQHSVRLANLTSQLELYREANAMSEAVSLRPTPALTSPPTEPRKSKPEAAAKAPEDVESGERVFMDEGVTLSTLHGLVNTGTSVQAQDAIEPYVGKWIRITGWVGNVISDGDILAVALSQSEKATIEMPGATLFFVKDRDQVRGLGRGEPIQALGRLHRGSGLGLMFSECELA